MDFSPFFRHPFVAVIGALAGVILGIPCLFAVAVALRFLFGWNVAPGALTNNGLFFLPFALVAANSYVNFFETHGWGFRWAFTKLTAPLQRPGARICFLFSVLSAAAVVVLVVISPSHFLMLLNDLGDKVFGYSNYMWWDATRILTATSLISCLLFAIFAYTYDRSIGALISWVRGSTD